jgi:predicted helicase
MSQLNLKANSAAVKKYFDALANYKKLGAKNEGAVSDAFADLLKHCARQFKWTLVNQFSLERKGKPPLRMDGVLLDASNIRRGIWEAKDDSDNLAKEVKKKVELGYPTNNILFQQPERATLLQSGKVKRDFDLTDPQELVDALATFFEFVEPEIDEWERAVELFSERIPELAKALEGVLEEQKKTNKEYAVAFAAFADICRQAINPNIGDDAVERMLIQHLLTERIFRKIFNNPEFRTRNVIAAEIEKVITALTKKSFSRDGFLAPLEHFYGAIERAASTRTEWSEKQSFLIKVYERFFQSFSAKEADTHGIVYTPIEIVRFMVRSVEEILKKEFGRSLSDENVHILDPFVGTGTFILEVMKAISRTAIEQKYKSELHCNEIMLLPYYIASMNIEHEFFEQTGRYEPFEGICLVDTFELAEPEQGQLGFMTEENSARVKRQKKAPIFVVIGNPPYNAWQADQNDNNKNRKYKTLDKRVADTYTRSSNASNRTALSDPYVKAFRFASDRIKDQGVVAFISNSSFADGIAFDGMREHLAADFDKIYQVDLKGNVRRNPKISGTTHNVFGIQVGVCITLLVRNGDATKRQATLFSIATEEFWRKEQRFDFLGQLKSITSAGWNSRKATRGPWFGEAQSTSTDLSIADVFSQHSYGNDSGRDAWVYNFSAGVVQANCEKLAKAYNAELSRWFKAGKPEPLDEFLVSDGKQIKWTRNSKRDLKNGKELVFSTERITKALYRPFNQLFLCSGRGFSKEVGRTLEFYPPEIRNGSICVAGPGTQVFSALGADLSGCGDLLGRTQIFPFYIFEEDGSNRRENIADGTLDQFRTNYSDRKISKWDIFYYVYAVLHHPVYRERYAANLKRELPRIPYAPRDSFWPLVKAGKRLMEIHVEYEKQPEYNKLKQIEKDRGKDKFWRVEKMRLSRDKTQLIYNEWLTLSDIPKEVYDYRLGNRSALEWVVDQYQVSTDKRSGIVNDPNREDDPQYIYKLIKKVITVSLETVEIVKGLPDLGLPKEEKAEAAKVN